MPMKKGSLVNKSYVFWTNVNSVDAFFVVQYVLLLNAKDTTDPIKHQEFIVDETWAIIKKFYQFSYKNAKKRKGQSLIIPTFLNRF